MHLKRGVGPIYGDNFSLYQLAWTAKPLLKVLFWISRPYYDELISRYAARHLPSIIQSHDVYNAVSAKNLHAPNISQKQEIRNKRTRFPFLCLIHTQNPLAEWSVQQFHLWKQPGEATLSYIFDDHHCQPKKPLRANLTTPKKYHNTALDAEVYNWVYNMQSKRYCIAGFIIQDEARKMALLGNERLSGNEEIDMKFSDGWLSKLKKRWNLISIKLHRESRYVDETALPTQVAGLYVIISLFRVSDIFNRNKYGICYEISSNRILETYYMSARKLEKTWYTFLCAARRRWEVTLNFHQKGRHALWFWEENWVKA